MTELEIHLNQLMMLMKECGSPSLESCIFFVEDTSIIHGMPSLIPRSSIISMADYEARFDSHPNAGHSWINMNAAGILDGTLLVIIELPTHQNNVPKGRVSVNFSGAALVNGKSQWDASESYRIVD
jgi:hypothetical protein